MYGLIFLTAGEKYGLVIASVHALIRSQIGNPFFFFYNLGLCPYCVRREGLHTSLKPEEALVYL